MKQTRKIDPPARVIDAAVDDGVTIGTPRRWQNGAAISVRVLETSPSTTSTPFRSTSSITAGRTWSLDDRSSTVTTSMRLPRTPPPAFASSTARRMPRSVASPNAAFGPDIEP